MKEPSDNDILEQERVLDTLLQLLRKRDRGSYSRWIERETRNIRRRLECSPVDVDSTLGDRGVPPMRSSD